jgi:hypothetical protein
MEVTIVHSIPAQGERNADHLLEAGAAIRGNNLPALAWKIDRLLDDPARQAAMRARRQAAETAGSGGGSGTAAHARRRPPTVG